ncbi:hypothetical protein ACFL2Y_02205 [Candidatus Omnitrophota bacterium]
MKAISLISGGLDSTLATKLILEQGIEVIGLNCISPISKCDHNNCNCIVKRSAENLGIELKVIDFTKEFLSIVKNPSHGYGSNMNPCIDCRILLLKKAKQLMQDTGAKFIITGEVVGQRPMSQNRPTLLMIEKKAEVRDILVRPLSAKLLEPTEPERSGWIDREKLLSISGRGRKEQLSLAQKFDIGDYSTPAGGCFLTYEGYARKIEDLIKHNALDLENVTLLKIGRHFRISSSSKLIVGRDEKENQKLLDVAQKDDTVFEPIEEIRGPVALGRGEFDEKQIELSSMIIGRYCDNGYTNLQITIRKCPSDDQKVISCSPLKDNELIPFRI